MAKPAEYPYEQQDKWSEYQHKYSHFVQRKAAGARCKEFCEQIPGKIADKIVLRKNGDQHDHHEAANIYRPFRDNGPDQLVGRNFFITGKYSAF